MHRDVCDRAWDDGYGDAHRPTILDESEVNINVIEKLRDNEVTAGIHLIKAQEARSTRLGQPRGAQIRAERRLRALSLR